MAIDPVALAASSGTVATDPRYSVAAEASTSSTGATHATVNTGAGTQLKRSSDVSDVYSLGRDDFLKLLLAQLQNQDPTQPVDDKEMLAELAQFTMIDTLQGVQKSMEGTQLAQASSLIGKSVTGTGTDGQPLSGVVDSLVQDSTGITLSVNGRSISPTSVTSVVVPADAAGAAASSGSTASATGA